MDVTFNGFDGGLVERGVNEVRHVVGGGEVAHRVNLVLHEGDERRDDDGGSFHEEGWQLVAKGFATACGHEYKGVVAGKQITNDGFLVAFELVEAEEFFQRCDEVHVRLFSV